MFVCIEIEDLTGLIEAYQKRTFVEDLDYLQQKLGGMLKAHFLTIIATLGCSGKALVARVPSNGVVTCIHDDT